MGYENTLKFIQGEYVLPADSQKAYGIYRRFYDNYLETSTSDGKIKINPKSYCPA
jgi:hypothetical protein